MPGKLHIVNGDAFGDKLRKSSIDGEILVWRESLYEGPIGMRMSDSLLLPIRASYMFQKHGIPEDLFTSTTLHQEKQLDMVSDEASEVVLWFDQDLFDQLMLCYLLTRLSSLDGGLIRLSLIQYDQKIEHQIPQLYSELSPITEGQLNLAAKVWSAYSASEPLSLAVLMGEDLSELPFLKRALEANLGRYPSMQNGLSSLEQLILEEIDRTDVSLYSLFQHVSEKASDFGLGDMQFWGMLEQLRLCEHPLVSLTGGDRLPQYGEPLPVQFENWRVSLTDAGKLVLTGKEDHIALNGIDDWIGGVHLQGKQLIWRLDPANSGFSEL
ncbi:DUF1835 domain-containing protein [Paenibacillus chondroitinus]|uniref:DUF1835 domain-containing protein n=1 Tax=Paenibacillus chondroitinus TaxID=59842 RepID=A0ABU6DM66_9BACL|nr:MULTISPECIES: DUF1835 domain-containing protein [Paenibacillus]MCY9661995.1 DUF1835 domain-containing protein [Paenibacillus anseongense]MEB4798883.1 DUF1835 domain-containing protein [Paenibacillus chondroitinus]